MKNNPLGCGMIFGKHGTGMDLQHQVRLVDMVAVNQLKCPDQSCGMLSYSPDNSRQIRAEAFEDLVSGGTGMDRPGYQLPEAVMGLSCLFELSRFQR